jgi:hypothetical protein
MLFAVTILDFIWIAGLVVAVGACFLQLIDVLAPVGRLLLRLCQPRPDTAECAATVLLKRISEASSSWLDVDGDGEPTVVDGGGMGRKVPRQFRDQRAAARRTGNPVEVQIADADATAVQGTGQVLDRSRTGIRMAVPGPVKPGTVLCVRSAWYGDDAPWVRVEVRRCRPSADGCVVGCRFTEALPWSTVLLFG